MKSKQPSKPRNTEGLRTLKLTPGPRSLRTPFRASSATLIAQSDAEVAEIVSIDDKASGAAVILIEDNRLLLEGLSAVLSAHGLKVVGTARTGADALRHVARMRPHLVLLDATLGDRDSLGIVTAVKKVYPEMKIIVMHLLPVQEDVVAFVRAGVSGFIMKDASLADFVSTIRSVADGESVLPPLIAGTLFSHIAEQAITERKPGVKAAMRMTAREREVTGLIGEGLGNSEIAEKLGIASHTVRSHVHNILEKLALHTRLEVAAYTHAARGRLRKI
jgi:DNA-binding NarL/FixJ family response regulator